MDQTISRNLSLAWAKLKTAVVENKIATALALTLVGLLVGWVFLTIAHQQQVKYAQWRTETHYTQEKAVFKEKADEAQQLRDQLAASDSALVSARQKAVDADQGLNRLIDDQERFKLFTEKLSTPMGQLELLGEMIGTIPPYVAEVTLFDHSRFISNRMFIKYGSMSTAAYQTIRAFVIANGSRGVALLYDRLGPILLLILPHYVVEVIHHNKPILVAENVDWRVVGLNFSTWYIHCKPSTEDSTECAAAKETVHKAFGVESLTNTQWFNIGQFARLWSSAGQDGTPLVNTIREKLLEILRARGLHQ